MYNTDTISGNKAQKIKIRAKGGIENSIYSSKNIVSMYVSRKNKRRRERDTRTQ